MNSTSLWRNFAEISLLPPASFREVIWHEDIADYVRWLEYLTMPQITTIGEPNIARLAISTVSSIDRGYQDWLHHAMLCSRNKKDKAVKPTLIETLLSCAHRWCLFNGANYLHFPHCSFWTFSSSITVTIVSFKQRKRNSILVFHAWKSWRC